MTTCNWSVGAATPIFDNRCGSSWASANATPLASRPAATAQRRKVLRLTVETDMDDMMMAPEIRPPGWGDKNGRASCRERACQYVSISVVAVTLKKNK